MLNFSKLHLGLTGSGWLLALTILLGILFAIFVYRWTNPPVSRGLRYLLIALRMIALCIVLFILFEPILSLTWFKTQKSLIGILIDTSGSMDLTDAKGSRAAEARTILSHSIFKGLSEKNEVEFFKFADKLEELRELQLDSLTFMGDGTNIQGALNAFRKKTADKYLRAVVMITDGADNLGDNPARYAGEYGVPIFPIPVGDPAEQKDALISRVMTNQITYAKNKVPIEVLVRANGYENIRLPISLKQGTHVLDTQTIQLSGNTLERKVIMHFVPEKEGVFKYQVEIPKLEGELTALNNDKTFYVKVLKSRMKILIIAGSPSADFSFLKRAFQSDENIEVTAFIEKKNGQFYQGQFPSDIAMLGQYDCFILLDFPRPRSSISILQTIKQVIDKHETPLLLFSGKNVYFNKLEPLKAYLPIRLRVPKTRERMVYVNLIGPGLTHPLVRLAEEQAENTRSWSDLPPIYYSYLNAKVIAGAEILAAVNKSRSGMPTSLPEQALIVSKRTGAQKSAAFLGYGLWRWDFLMWGIGKNNQYYQQILNNTIRWLVTKEDSKLIRITADKEIYRGGEPISFTGQAYFEDYRPMDGAKIRVVIRKGERQHEINLAGVGDGKYEGQLPVLDGGDYTFEGIAFYKDRKIGSDTGKFSVEQFNLEFQSTRMKRELLQQIARQSGGEVVVTDSLQKLSEKLVFPPKRSVQSREWELWNKLTLMIIAIACLSIEWFVRKRKGMM